VGRPVKALPRTRRAERAAATRQRIIEAAAALFENPGYPSATIDAIAVDADVAVETVYARFGNKAGVLKAVLDQAIIGTDRGPALLEQSALTEVQHCTDQAEQLRLLARFSTGILTRAIRTHRILETAAAIDRAAAELLAQDLAYRLQTQQAHIDFLLLNGPLRDGLSKADAASTYSALASPETFDFLTRQQEWTTAKFETWLAESLINLLLPSSAM
jgi:AcrR family transcriptional regulator